VRPPVDTNVCEGFVSLVLSLVGQKAFNYSKIGASRQDEKNSAWKRGYSWLRFSNPFALSREKKLPSSKKSSLPDCRENYSHRGAGLLINTDAPSNATSKIKEKEKIFPSSKKVASRVVMKTLHTVERGDS
jgi:hypothetical protein